MLNKMSVGYETLFADLPPQAQSCVHFIERYLEVPGMSTFSPPLSPLSVKWVGVRKFRDSIIKIF
uniref:Uncharacterized protein n=1 Tax=Gopherus evgoodei TaxID=1825980 RepID=A0A8C4Y0R0_9SAUR